MSEGQSALRRLTPLIGGLKTLVLQPTSKRFVIHEFFVKVRVIEYRGRHR